MDQLEKLIGTINEEHTLIAYGQMFILTNGARALMDPCDWYTFRWMRRTMWHSVFPKNPDECLFNLWIDNGMITRLFPYETEARPNFWRYKFRHDPIYRDYRFLVDDALRSHRIIYGPLVQYPVVYCHQQISQYMYQTSRSMQFGIQHQTAGKKMQYLLDGRQICMSISSWIGYQSMQTG